MGQQESTAYWWNSLPQERFWVEITDRQDIGADLKCPQANKAGKTDHSYSLINLIWPGDIIFHYSTPVGGFIGASVAGGPVEERPIIWTPHSVSAKPIKKHDDPVPGWRLSDAFVGFRALLGPSDMLAYLAMMAPRLRELHRVLKRSGSLFLHCDPTASHYLKVLTDAIFGGANFRNEVVWKRSDAHNDAKQGAKHFGRVHDVLLFYTKSDDPFFRTLYRPLPQSTVENWYRNVEEDTGRRYNKADVTGPGGAAKGNAFYDWKGNKRYHARVCS